MIFFPKSLKVVLATRLPQPSVSADRVPQLFVLFSESILDNFQLQVPMPLKSSVISFQNVQSGSRDSFHLFHSSSSGKNSSASLPTTDESLSEPSSYFSSTKKYSSGRPYRIPKLYYPVQMNRKLRDM